MKPISQHGCLAFVILLSGAFFWLEPASAEILFKADFETGDFSQFSGKSKNMQAAWDWVMFATQPANMVLLTTTSGWVAGRVGDMDWSGLLKTTPQYEVFVTPPKEMVYYPEPVLTPWDEIQTRVADQLPAAFIDPALKDDPKKVADFIHKLATQTDQLLKEADLYGT